MSTPVSNVVEGLKNAVIKQDLLFDVGCYVFDYETENKYLISEVVDEADRVCVYFSGVWDRPTYTVDDVWTALCLVRDTKPLVFINVDNNTEKSFDMVDDCLGDTIDFNVK